MSVVKPALISMICAAEGVDERLTGHLSSHYERQLARRRLKYAPSSRRASPAISVIHERRIARRAVTAIAAESAYIQLGVCSSSALYCQPMYE